VDGAPAELRIDTVEGGLVLVHDNHLVAALEQAQGQVGAHAPAAYDNEVHDFSFESETW
jgi:hypothetical protein